MGSVGEVMSRAVFTVKPETPFKDVVETLLRNDVSGVPVVNDEGRLLGIVTEADLVSKEAYGGRRRRPLRLLADAFTGDVRWVQRAKGLTAEAIMTPWPWTVRPTDDTAFAARRMLESRVKRLPVVDDEHRVVGIVSRHDLLRAREPETDAALTRPEISEPRSA
ncbi:MAG TPA: CBS domain-containing protein [Acidimicrobiia bacterium]|nr:CBS domain-containing protein [Acidimicrobiia bacterium]